MEKAIKGSAYDGAEEKLVIRFEKGVDFDTFDEFRKVFLGILNSESQAHGRGQLQRMEQMQGNRVPFEGVFDIGVPVAMLNMTVLEAKTSGGADE